jgi:hypothetical protein
MYRVWIDMQGPTRVERVASIRAELYELGEAGVHALKAPSFGASKSVKIFIRSDKSSPSDSNKSSHSRRMQRTKARSFRQTENLPSVPPVEADHSQSYWGTWVEIMSAGPVVPIQLAGYEDTKKGRGSYTPALACNLHLEQAPPLASGGSVLVDPLVARRL